MHTTHACTPVHSYTCLSACLSWVRNRRKLHTDSSFSSVSWFKFSNNAEMRRRRTDRGRRAHTHTHTQDRIDIWLVGEFRSLSSDCKWETAFKRNSQQTACIILSHLARSRDKWTAGCLVLTIWCKLFPVWIQSKSMIISTVIALCTTAQV